MHVTARCRISVPTVALWLFVGCSSLTAVSAADQPPPISREDFSFGYWKHGWRNTNEKTPRVLCLEAGRYGFALDPRNLRHPQCGRLTDQPDYRQTLVAGTARMDGLASTELDIGLTVAGRVYRATSCPPAAVRLWESGQLCQHYDLLNLQFQDDTGRLLNASGTLDIVAWPDSLSFTASCTPDSAATDGLCEGVVGNAHCVAETPLTIPHDTSLEPNQLTAECWVKLPTYHGVEPTFQGWLLCKNGSESSRGNYGFRFKNDRLSAVLNNAGGWNQTQTIQQRQALSFEQWHHVALTFDGSLMRFYVDGNEQGSQAVPQPRQAGTGPLVVGQRSDGHGSLVRGCYDQVRIWNRPLSAAEIATHATQPGALPDRGGLLFERTFDQGTPLQPAPWTDAELSIGFRAAGQTWRAQKAIPGVWKPGTWQQVSLACPMAGGGQASQTPTATLATSSGQQFPVAYDATFNALVARVEGVKRSRPFTMRDYDEFDLVLQATAESPAAVPLVVDFRGPAQITGLVPLLCQPDGSPTGVPVQVSKNWHHGSYLRAAMLVPVSPGENRYRLRIVYGFYGSLPSASHAQLSLIGWGNNQRWDQLALMCGGEMITFDVDMSCTDVAVCDVRLPFGKNGKDGQPWNWTEAGWGGDWLGVFDTAKQKLTFAGMKAATFSPGPCLTDAAYHGGYGPDQSVVVDAHVRVPRTDDYGRTFQTLRYAFTQDLPATGSYLLRRHATAFDQSIAYGNAAGLLAEVPVNPSMKPGDFLVGPTELTGPGPWWIAFPKRSRRGQRDWGVGSVSLVLRNYRAQFGSRQVTQPWIQARIKKIDGGEATLETWVVPPPGVTDYHAGDLVELDTEWLHLHRNADDYCGENALYRQHLEAHPQSWETTYREVQKNTPTVDVKGGTLLEQLPIVIRADQPTVTLSITGGVGYLPVRIEGLAAPTGWKLVQRVDGNEIPLDQSAHGNDFWQTDYDPSTSRYAVSFNLPAAGEQPATWMLTHQHSNPTP